MRVERWLVTIPLKLRSVFRRQQLDQELDEEIRHHLEHKIGAYVAAGSELHLHPRPCKLWPLAIGPQ
jgi:hypothetical protein